MYLNSVFGQSGKAPVWLLSILVIMVSTAGGAFLWHQMNKSTVDTSSSPFVAYPEPRNVADLKLVDHYGEPFSLWQMKGNWSLLFFGFTSCPDICPDTLFKMRQVRENLAASDPALASQIRFYFVSVDPERDTPAKMTEYLAYFDPEITGLTGVPAMLQAVGMQLGVGFHIDPHEPGETAYGVDHSSGLVLMNPSGQLHGIFRPPHEVAAVSSELERLLNLEN